MKELKREINIAYRWWRSDKKPIRPEHIEALEESAWNLISWQVHEHNNTSGELIDNIYMDDKDLENGIDYRGYWEIK